MRNFSFSILGVRGSKPICNESYMKYGGNTFCIAVEVNGLCLIFDSGTGISGFKNIDNYQEINLFYTHYHIDHICGLYYFDALYNREKKVNIYGPEISNHNVKEVVDLAFNNLFFPVQLNDLSAKIEFNDIKIGESLKISDVTINTFMLRHPAGCVGYSIEYLGKKLCICTDTAPIRDEAKRQKFLKFIDNSDYLIYDAFFMPDNEREDWGHGTYLDAVDLMTCACIDKMLLIHYSDCCDEVLDDIALKINRLNDKVCLSREGIKIYL